MKKMRMIIAIVSVAVLCCSCEGWIEVLDAVVSKENNKFPENQYWKRAYRVINNQTSQPLRVVYGFFDYGPTLPDGGEMCDYPVGVGEKVITNCCAAFREEDEVVVSNFDIYPSEKSRSQKIIIYDANRLKVLYTIDYEGMKDESLWQKDWRLNDGQHFVMGDYLEWYIIEDIERGRLYDYTFLYWTATLTDEMLAEWAERNEGGGGE